MRHESPSIAASSAATGWSPLCPMDSTPTGSCNSSASDKKAIDGITFVLDGPNGVEPVLVEDTELLMATMERVTR